jgi:hypothetical protein
VLAFEAQRSCWSLDASPAGRVCAVAIAMPAITTPDRAAISLSRTAEVLEHRRGRSRNFYRVLCRLSDSSSSACPEHDSIPEHIHNERCRPMLAHHGLRVPIPIPP